MPLYPLFADLRERAVLVVGGGEVATRKVEALLQAGALVTVCAPQLSPSLAALCAAGRLQHRADPFDPDWLDAVWLVTPTSLHVEQIKQSLLAGVHVFCEKPVSLTVEACDDAAGTSPGGHS